MSKTKDEDTETDGSVSSSDAESDDESSGQENDETSDTCSYRSLAFQTKNHRKRAVVTAKKSKKRVRFKPGDSLVLIYIIPNREMLGLKSGSEDSDESGEESDDEDDDDDENEDDDDDDENDEDEDNDDDDEEDDEDDEDDDDDNDSGDEDEEGKKTSKTKKPKPFAKLLAVKQVNRRKLPDLRSNVKRAQEKNKLNIDIVSTSNNTKKKQRAKNKKDRKEKSKASKNVSRENKSKQSRGKRNRTNAIKADVDKTPKVRRGRPRLLEIRATVEPPANKTSSHVSVPKVMYRSDFKPALIDVNSNGPIVVSKPLTNRVKLQTTSVRITKESDPIVSNAGNKPTIEKPSSVAKVVSASYDSLTSVMPTSYIDLSALRNNVVEETVERLDPDNMNTSGKRNYAWQIANGTISSQSLRTPSILPFWDSLQNSVT